MSVHLPDKVWKVGYWLIPSICAVLVFAGTFWSPFVYDDRHMIEGNLFLLSLSEPFTLFTKPVWYGIEGTGPDARYFRPTMMAWFWGLWHLVSHDPFVFHLGNVLLHAVTTGLVAILGYSLLGRRDAAFVAALLFAFQSVHSEPVAWVAASGDLLAALFTLLAYLLSLKTDNLRIALACVCLFLALCAKEIALMIAAVRVLALVFEGKKSQAYRAAGLVALVTLIYLGFRLVASSGLPSGQPLNVFSRWYFFEIFGRFLCMLVVPSQFELHYGPEFLGSPTWTQLAPYALLCLAFFGTLFWSFRRSRKVELFCLVWISLSLLPACNLIPIPLPLGERSAYLASAASCWLIGWLVTKRAWVAYLVLAVLLPIYSYQLGQRLPDWADETKLWASSVKRNPANFETLHGLAQSFMLEGSYSQASGLYGRIWAVVKSEAITLSLAESLLKEKRYEEASGLIVKIPPGNPLALEIIGHCQFQLGRYEHALGLWSRCPPKAEIVLTSAIAHHRLGNLPQAQEFAQRARNYPSTQLRAEALLKRLESSSP